MRVSLVFLVVFFSAPFQGKLNSVAGACACGCASVGPAGSGGRRDLQVGHEGATCPSPGTDPPPPVTRASASCVPKRHGEEVGTQWLLVPRSLGDGVLGRPCPTQAWGGGSGGAGGTRAAPLHQQLSLPGQLPGRGRGRGARQLHPEVQLARAQPPPWCSCGPALPQGAGVLWAGDQV